jgi:hypothetical protein
MMRRTPEVIATLTADLDEADSLWKPAPDRWSVLEVVGHLVEADAAAFRPRTEMILAQKHPTLPGIDPATLGGPGAYTARPLPQAIERFREERATSLVLLARVREADMSRTAHHAGLECDITLGHLLNEWPLHDLGHIRQIAELIRARKFHPHIGPWQEIYPMRP